MHLIFNVCLLFYLIVMAVHAQNDSLCIQHVAEEKTWREDLYPSRQNGEETVMKRIDPVIHQSWTPEAPISREQHDYFDTNGFLIMKDFFNQEQIQELNVEAKRLQENSKDLNGIITEMNSDSIRNIWQLAEQSEVFGKLSRNKQLLSIVRYLLNDEVYIHQSELIPKRAFYGKEFHWHSDFEIWHSEDGMPRMRVVSALVMLKNNTYTNGPLMFVPQTHKLFVSLAGITPEDHHIHSLKQQNSYVKYSNELIKQMVDSYGTSVIVGDAGTVVLFDPNLLHASNGNLSPYDRTNTIFVYNSMRNQLQFPFSTRKQRPEFLARRKNIRSCS